MDQKIRVFVSYSSNDLPLVENIVEMLEEEGMSVLWTKELKIGEGFDEQLKIFIEHSHVFMPILTESASARGWVHQEIGYAIALNIPVFPVTTEKISPGGMLNLIQAKRLSDDLVIRRKQLSIEEFRDLISRVGFRILAKE